MSEKKKTATEFVEELVLLQKEMCEVQLSEHNHLELLKNVVHILIKKSGFNLEDIVREATETAES